MIASLNSLFNPYDRKARLAPVLLCATPLLAPSLLLFSEIGPIWTTVSGLVLYCGGVEFLTQVGRDRGNVLEPNLHESWGGKPSVAMLRHSDTRLIAPTKYRYRTFLQSALHELTLASPEEERIDPKAADEGYQSAISWLLAQTRNRGRFGLLFAENINYGFRRNVWALKRWAFVVEVCAFITVVWAVFETWTGETLTTFRAIGPEVWVNLIIISMHSLLFTLKIRPAWVRIAADAYALQLLAACDILEIEHRALAPQK